MSALDTQIAGDHYKVKGIQPVEYIHANSLDFFEGNVVKYITRWKDKGGVEDLDKVIHYTQMLKELVCLQQQTLKAQSEESVMRTSLKRLIPRWLRGARRT